MSSTAFGYRPSINYSHIPTGHPVCVAVTFNVLGEMRIDSFGAEISGSRFRYKIKTCLLLKEHQGIMTYDCTYVEFGLVKTVRLQYYITQCRWVIG